MVIAENGCSQARMVSAGKGYSLGMVKREGLKSIMASARKGCTIVRDCQYWEVEGMYCVVRGGQCKEGV